MSRKFSLIFNLILLILVSFNLSWCFQEDAIFEEEDIYNQALPPKENASLVIPGTKWCGPGNSAKNYDDLGTHRETDICCRAHDHCKEIIEPQKNLNGLSNPDWFPRMSCQCEQTFLNCLQEVNSFASNTIGRVYFGTRKNCFQKQYPVLNCSSYQNATLRKRCVRYNFDKNKSKTWQFFDIPFYTTKSN